MTTVDQLRRLNGTVTYHRFGVVKLRVKDQFWHFYSDRTPVVLKENIHSHPYPYESKILFGGIRHHIYAVKPSEEESKQNYRMRMRMSGNTSPLNVVYDNIELIKSATFDTYKQDTYTIEHSVLHQIELITPKCVTHLTAGRWGNPVYFVLNKELEFTKDDIWQRVSTDECWEIIEYTLDDEDNS